MKKRKQESTVVVISTKHGFATKTWLGETMKGFSEDVYVILLFLYLLEKVSFDLMFEGIRIVS